MGVYGHTRVPVDHAGVVTFAFVDGQGEVVRWNRVYTRNDANLVYDALRLKYPELDDHRLVVRVKEAHEVTFDEQRGVAARKLREQPVGHPPGEPFLRYLDWLGPRPQVKAPGVMLEAVGSGPVPERLGEALTLLTTGEPWKKAEGGWPR